MQLNMNIFLLMYQYLEFKIVRLMVCISEL